MFTNNLNFKIDGQLFQVKIIHVQYFDVLSQRIKKSLYVLMFRSGVSVTHLKGSRHTVRFATTIVRATQRCNAGLML